VVRYYPHTGASGMVSGVCGWCFFNTSSIHIPLAEVETIVSIAHIVNYGVKKIMEIDAEFHILKKLANEHEIFHRGVCCTSSDIV